MPKFQSNQPVRPRVAAVAAYPTARTASTRDAGSNAMISAPIAGAAMIAVRIGKSVTDHH